MKVLNPSQPFITGAKLIIAFSFFAILISLPAPLELRAAAKNNQRLKNFKASRINLSKPEIRRELVAKLGQQSADKKRIAWEIAARQGWKPKMKIGYKVLELMAIKNGRVYMYTTANADSAVSSAVDLIRNTPPYNLSGNNLTVGIWDEGLVRDTHQELAGRVTLNDSAGNSSHSTHVSGTIAAQGVDPDAKGMASSALIDSFDWNDDVSEMTSLAMSYPDEPGTIQISNHSYTYIAGWSHSYSPPRWYGTWGYRESDNFGQYSSETADWDSLCYNAPYYLPFKAAGNDRTDNAPSAGGDFEYYNNGWKTKTYDPNNDPYDDDWDNGGFDTIPLVGNAKNIMTVGAVSDAVSGGSRDIQNASMTSFSSWGPTDDGRVKPDIVANGTTLYSCTAGSDSSYATYSGTSMASPGAAGAAVLLTEYYEKLYPGRFMLSSSIKGLMIQTADDLGNPGPDYSFGWGLINARAAAELMEDIKIKQGLLTDSEPSDTYIIEADANSSIRVTLCWTDPPANSVSELDNNSPMLINDLDLRVYAPNDSNTFYPYILNPDNPAEDAERGDNYLDNVEQVYIPEAPGDGIYTIEITHKGTLADSQQYYSLICNNEFFSPPIAKAVSKNTPINTPVTITLDAADDGRPDPPGEISYIITSLPTDGNLTNPNAGLITSIPYTLTEDGNGVIYEPNVGFLGNDEFTYKADDSGIAPYGGESDIETITINVYQKPADFYEDFEDELVTFVIDNSFGTGDGLWHITSTCQSADPAGHSEPNSLYYGIDNRCDYHSGNTEGVATSAPINLLNSRAPILLKFNYYLQTEGDSSYDIAEVQISRDDGAFVTIASNSDGTLLDPSSGWVEKQIDISDYCGSMIKLRFSFRTVDKLNNKEPGFYFDDVAVIGTYTGDFEPDGDVDFYDFARLASAWLSDPESPKWDVITDISNPADGIINENDLVVFAENWLKGN